MIKSVQGAFRKRTAVALALISVILSVSAVSAAYYLSSPQSSEKENSLPSVSPPPTTSLTPSPIPPSTPTPAPSPTPTAPTSIAAKADFGFEGSFEAKYSFDSRVLSVSGHVIWAANIALLITYSIDGSGSYALPVVITPLCPDKLDYPRADLSGSDVLPLLSVGHHSITVYGNWTKILGGPGFDVTELNQASLNFTVQIETME
jgi:hypothetical protein